jgi:hypothetical protein
LIEQPEFIDQIRAIREGMAVEEIAARYVRRNQGRRVEAVAVFLQDGRHGRTAPHGGDRQVQRNERRQRRVVGRRAPRARTAERNLRSEAVRSIEEGAMRVARRGAGRCVKLDCCHFRGAKLRDEHGGDHCSLHRSLDLRSRYFVEVDRRFWRDLLLAVLDRW